MKNLMLFSLLLLLPTMCNAAINVFVVKQNTIDIVANTQAEEFLVGKKMACSINLQDESVFGRGTYHVVGELTYVGAIPEGTIFSVDGTNLLLHDSSVEFCLINEAQ